MLTNNKIKEINKLYQAKYRKLENKFIVEGPHLINEAKIYGNLLEVYTISNDIEGILITESEMKKICNTESVIKAIGICKYLDKNELKNKILMLDRIQDPGNLGTLLRSAVAFNFSTIVLNKGCVDIYNDKVIRSSQGAIFKLNFIFSELEDFINTHTNYLYFSTNVSNGYDVNQINIKNNNIGLILGNEGSGVKDNISKLVNNNLYIKTIDTESLNVSIAGSILMYELSKKIRP